VPRSAGRLLALLELLQAHHVLGGAELARRLDVDERTVRRYVGTLADLGVPVTAGWGRYGGYRRAELAAHAGRIAGYAVREPDASAVRLAGDE
jgi:predicted DNA-binding transcriptional regulator YafY